MKKYEVDDLLRLMGNSIEKNDATLIGGFKKHGIGQSDYLFTLTDELHNEKKCLLAIKSLINSKHAYANSFGPFRYNFIQNAIYAGYSDKFIMELIDFCSQLNNNLRINHQDEDGDTMLHTAIYADDFVGDISEIYKVLINYGFDSRITDNSGRNIVSAMLYENKLHNKFSKEQVEAVRKLYDKEITRLSKEVKRNSPLDKILEKMGYDLYANKEFLKEELPKIGIKGDTILFGLTNVLHHELSCFAAIKSLLHFEVCRVNEVDDNKYNFIQNALYAGYGSEFINACIEASSDGLVTHQLNINHQDEDGDTMLHTAIYANDSASVDIASFYKKLLAYGFDSRIKDNEGRTIIDAMYYEKKRCNKFNDAQIHAVEMIYNEVLARQDTSFSEEVLESNRVLCKAGLDDFLKKCNRK